jgi:tetratricopeptide (TPR) repeat protein
MIMPKNQQKIAVQKPVRNINRSVLCCMALVCITVIVFAPSLKNGFTNWDDDIYVTRNPAIRGFTAQNLAAFFSSPIGYYHPLTMLTFMAEYSIFKLNPFPYHLNSLLIHCINCLLVFALILALSRNRPMSFLVGLLFAIHPLRVESVAWIAERKDVLSGLFFLLSLLSYVYYLKKGNWKLYLACLFSLILSLLSKPMAVSQPLILLLIYYLTNKKIDAKAIVKMVPFFAIIAIFAATAFLTQKSYGAIANPHLYSILQRIGIPFYGIAFYITKTILPLRLSAYYPLPGHEDMQMNLQLLLAPILVIGAGVAIFFTRRSTRKVIFGSLFFLFTLAPMLQIMPLGGFIVAERYAYIPTIGLYFIIAEGLSYLFRTTFRDNSAARTIVYAGLGLVLICMCWITFKRCAVWKNSLSLWNDVLDKKPCWVGYYNRGIAYNAVGDYDHAIEDFSREISLNPADARAYYDQGLAYCYKKDFDRGLEDFNVAIALNPRYAQAYNNRGNVYYVKGNVENAIADFSQAIMINPQFYQAYFNRAIAFRSIGDNDQARDDMEKCRNQAP